MRGWISAFFLAILAVPASADELPTIHLKVVGGLGQTVQYRNFEEPFWTKQLAERSGGKVTAEVIPWDRAGVKGGELLGFIRLGAIPIGAVSLSQIASEDPEAAAVDLAGLNPDVAALRSSIAAYLPTLRELYHTRYGIEILAVWSYPAQVVFCNRSTKSTKPSAWLLRRWSNSGSLSRPASSSKSLIRGRKTRSGKT